MNHSGPQGISISTTTSPCPANNAKILKKSDLILSAYGGNCFPKNAVIHSETAWSDTLRSF